MPPPAGSTGRRAGAGGGHGHGSAPKTEEKRTAGSTARIMSQSISYMWPKSWLLRVDFVMSVVCLLLGNFSDICTPIALKYTVNQLTETSGRELPWQPILAYGGLRFAGNVFQQLRDIFFATVSSQTEREAALQTFRQLQALSLNFHLKRETGSILRSVSRGSQSFATLIRIALFQFLPVVFQVSIVCGYLLYLYDWYFALLTAGIIVIYFVFTIVTTRWRDQYRRVMNDKDNEYNQKATDSLLNFETVKAFNAEKHEEKRFDGALQAYTKANIGVQRSLALLNCGQNFIVSAGITGAMFLAGMQVTQGKMNVGDFVMIQGFILQLYLPLGFLGTYYRMIRQAIVDVESMFKLLGEDRDVVDAPDAKPLVVKGGEIEFVNVSFAYENKQPILKGISFKIGAGQKVAIVGTSGAGKSTIMRLIYRFFNVTGGEIRIDGQNIAKVTQSSLRSSIAIVPQDCVLFNDTIGYNVGYGIVGRRASGATQDEIETAARRAQIYNHIVSQPDGFDAKVGERGLRLSGGEKQRVAIARAILKAPEIMVFDEATSSLDTTTEAEIQQQLDEVSRGLTTLTIAHRLSTIANSDLILVLDKGRIVESGTHTDLLERNGTYASMWHRQEKSRMLKASLTEIEVLEEQHRKLANASPMPPSSSESDLASHDHPSDNHNNNNDARIDIHIDVPAAQPSSSLQPPANGAKQSKKKRSKQKAKNGAKPSNLTQPLLSQSDDDDDEHTSPV